MEALFGNHPHLLLYKQAVGASLTSSLGQPAPNARTLVGTFAGEKNYGHTTGLRNSRFRAQKCLHHLLKS